MRAYSFCFLALAILAYRWLKNISRKPGFCYLVVCIWKFGMFWISLNVWVRNLQHLTGHIYSSNHIYIIAYNSIITHLHNTYPPARVQHLFFVVPPQKWPCYKRHNNKVMLGHCFDFQSADWRLIYIIIFTSINKVFVIA